MHNFNLKFYVHDSNISYKDNHINKHSFLTFYYFLNIIFYLFAVKNINIDKNNEQN